MYILNKKSKKKKKKTEWKFKTIFFYVYPPSLRTRFSNKLLASDLLMLWIINTTIIAIFNIDDSNIAKIKAQHCVQNLEIRTPD